MMNNQKGLTLVEILATITILSIVGILVWSVFLQGTQYSNEALTKNQLTQEANYVQVNLKDIHQNTDEYKIIFPTPCSIRIEYNESDVFYLENAQICYEMSSFITSDDNSPINVLETSIYPKNKHYSISFELILKEKNNEANHIVTHTNLYRLKEDKS